MLFFIFIFNKKNIKIKKTLNFKSNFYNPLLPQTTSERENVNITIKAPQAILTISICFL